VVRDEGDTREDGEAMAEVKTVAIVVVGGDGDTGEDDGRY
jgi:hypothetical protein